MQTPKRSASLPQGAQIDPNLYQSPPGAPGLLQSGCQVFSGALAVAAANSKADCQGFWNAAGQIADKAGQLVDQFTEGLNNLLGGGPRRLRDAEFIRLSDWCSHNNKKEYGKRPRTLAVLKWTGCVDAIDGFVSDKLSDYALPYTERNLPRYIKGQQMRSRFLELQQYVLATKASDLETPGSPHLNIERIATQFFATEKVLGSGGFGVVYHVTSRLSLKQYALKRIPRGHSFNRDQAQIQMFTNELKNLKDLRHKHLVRLIGSYTDHDHIGLLMTPVADMNLADYLALPEMDAVGRKDCLRRFFGCLAAGVEYLHSKKIRHKDIKPLNVLVMRHTGRVLLADFGTSRNWADDGSSSSHGTARDAYTERYCAPEVSNSSRRNWATDIWSLGCIFLEMSSVLSGLTVRQMQQFFEVSGNGKQTVRENPAALNAWSQKIRQQVSLLSDLQALEVTLRLCHSDPIERPTAAQIAAEIVDFSGPVPYHCGCLAVNQHDSMQHDAVQEVQYDPNIGEKDSTPSIFSAIPCPTKIVASDLRVVYRPPYIQDIQEDMAVQHSDAAGQSICAPRATKELFTDGSALEYGHSTTVTPLSDNVLAKTYASPMQVEKPATTSCQWPSCSTNWPINDQDPFIGQLLCQHYRAVHGCHEFARHFWLLAPLQPTQTILGDQSGCFGVTLFKHSNRGSHELDPTVAAIYAARRSRRARTAQDQAAATAATAAVAESSSSDSGPPTPPDTAHVKSRSRRAKKANGAVRFDLLPDDRRPESVSPTRSSRTTDEDLDFRLHVESAFLPSNWPFLSHTSSRSRSRDGNSSPTSSFVPSYHLAASNRFSRLEIGTDVMADTKPLFVYGTLMFPSILYSCANFYTEGSGVYEPHLQRRLQTTSFDWGYANDSVKSAAQCMTPALIHAGTPIRPMYYPWAITRFDKGDTEVHGFLIFGLSREAYLCLEHWLNVEMPKRLGYNILSGSPKGFKRYEVAAEIQQDDSQIRVLQVNAYGSTDLGFYMWQLGCYGWKSFSPTLTQSYMRQKVEQWDLNQFARSPAFTSLCRDDWMEEEQQLARTMKMRCLMRGDVLAIAVLQNDKEQVQQLLEENCDVGAQCHQYGTALQAAAAKGHFEILEALVTHGANVNASNGSFGCPLVAACVHGHTEIVRYLLKKEANVLAEGGRHINALYQAVSFSDVELAHVLLEKGAWLAPNYKEILDLADEIGNRDISRMLEDYDVRDLHREKEIAYEPQRTRNRSRNRRASEGGSMAYIPYDERLAIDKGKSTGLLQAVMLEALSLRGKSGKWTGIKAVRVLRKALARGAPMSLIDKAAPALKDYSTLMDWVSQCQKEFQNMEPVSSNSGGDALGTADLLDHVLGQPRTRDRTRSRRLTDVSASFSDYYQDARQSARSVVTNISCLDCGGRGGKEGTGRRCRDCLGSGNTWQREGNHSKRVTCSDCRGQGHTFSRRDVCWACDGQGISRPTENRREPRLEEVAEEVDGPPPPYSMR